MALTGSQRRAITRALAHGGGAAVRRLRYGVYAVRSASRPGVVHTVTVDAAGAYGCTCPAGVWGRPCWHAAAVYVAKIEAGGARVSRAAGSFPHALRSSAHSPLASRVRLAA
jgi:hypothetical protein